MDKANKVKCTRKGKIYTQNAYVKVKVNIYMSTLFFQSCRKDMLSCKGGCIYLKAYGTQSF
jgi:hypothetical protein